MNDDEALRIYAVFTTAVLVSGLLGAVLGDLLIGNTKAILIGALLNALGAFILFIPSTVGLNIGLFLVVLGSGLFTPNLTSNFGKLYLNNTKLLDAGFTVLYFAINIGAFLGAFIVGSIGELAGWNYGFGVAGVLMFLSCVPILIIKNKRVEQSVDHQKVKGDIILDSDLVPANNKHTIQKQSMHRHAVLKVVVGVVSLGLFWMFYEFGYVRIYELQSAFVEQAFFDMPKSLWLTSASSFTIVLSLIAAIYWSYNYSNPFFKLILGFLFGIIAFGLLFLIPAIPVEQHAILYFLSLLSLGIAEISISPIMFSVLIRYTNPKYLSIFISLSMILVRLFIYVGSIVKEFISDLHLAAFLGMSSVAVLSVGFILYIKRTKSSDEDYAKMNLT